MVLRGRCTAALLLPGRAAAKYAIPQPAPIAQLDRASDYESKIGFLDSHRNPQRARQSCVFASPSDLPMRLCGTLTKSPQDTRPRNVVVVGPEWDDMRTDYDAPERQPGNGGSDAGKSAKTTGLGIGYRRRT